MSCWLPADPKVYCVCYFSSRSDPGISEVLFRLVGLQESGLDVGVFVVVHGLRGKTLSAFFQRKFSYSARLCLISYRPGLDGRLHRVFDFSGALFAVFDGSGGFLSAFNKFSGEVGLEAFLGREVASGDENPSTGAQGAQSKENEQNGVNNPPMSSTLKSLSSLASKPEPTSQSGLTCQQN